MEDYSCIRGIGIELSGCEKTTVEKIEKMLETAPEYRDYIHQMFEDCDITNPTVDDYYESGVEDIATVIAETINEAEGTKHFLYEEDNDGKAALMFCFAEPADYNEREKNLSNEEIGNILTKYYKMLFDNEPVISDISICWMLD